MLSCVKVNVVEVTDGVAGFGAGVAGVSPGVMAPAGGSAAAGVPAVTVEFSSVVGAAAGVVSSVVAAGAAGVSVSAGAG